MTPQPRAGDDPKEWLRRARSNLAMAKARPPDVYLEDLCFEAQQAAEKAIKAVLLKRRRTPPYVHDLGRLLTVLERTGEFVPAAVRHAEMLSRYAVVTRYPGLAEPVEERHYLEALTAAEAVLEWAERLISQEP